MLRNHLATTTWIFTSSFHHSQSTLLHAKIKNADEPQNCRKLDLFLVKVNKTILQFGYQSRVRAYFLWSYFDCNSYENTTIYKVFVCTHVDFNIQLLMLHYFHIICAFQRDNHYYCTSKLFEKTSKRQKSRV